MRVSFHYLRGMRGALVACALLLFLSGLAQTWRSVPIGLQLPDQYYPNGGPSLTNGTMTGRGTGFWSAAVFLSPSSGSWCWMRYTESEWAEVIPAGNPCGTNSYMPVDERTMFYLQTQQGITTAHVVTMVGDQAEHSTLEMVVSPYASYRLQPLDAENCMALVRYSTSASPGRIVLMKLTPAGYVGPMEVVPTYGDIQDMAFRNEQVGVVALTVDNGPQEIWATQDGGISWLPVWSNATARIRSAHWLDGETLWLIGDEGLVLSTQDLGSNWTTIEPPMVHDLRAIAAYSADSVWLGDDQGHIHATGDGGATWTSHAFVSGSSVFRIHAFEGVVYAYTSLPSPSGGLHQVLYKWEKEIPVVVLGEGWWLPTPHGIELVFEEGEDLHEFRLFDVSGREVRALPHGLSVSMQHLPAGIYMARLRTDQREASAKLFWKGRP